MGEIKINIKKKLINFNLFFHILVNNQQ